MKSKRYLWIISMVLLLSFAITSCTRDSSGAANQIPTEVFAPLEIIDGLGRTVKFDQPAQKIISIAPSNTEILYALGAGSQIVGRDEFSDYPEEAKQITNVGGGFGALDTETIVSLQPDLVLAAEINSPEQVKALEDLGLNVYLLANPKDLEGLLENVIIIGQVTGNIAEAQELAAELRGRISVVDEMISKVEERPLVFYQLDSSDLNAPWTAGAGTFIDTLINRAGGNNLGSSLSDAYAQISIEQLLVQDPNVILVGDYTWGGVTVEDVISRPGWSEIEAVKEGRVYVFDDNLVSRPGPRMVDGLEEMAMLLHPDLFE